MIALVDADIVVHRIGFTTENDPESIARVRCDDLLDRIILDTKSDEFRLFLSDSKENNFRYQIDSTYKANRISPKPKHYDFIKEHLILNWGAQISYNMEADDYLGIHQDQEYLRTTICSIDKDLMQIPGLHYNFVKESFHLVSPEEGLLSFYRSILTGDVADNIKGIYGIGPAKVAKILPKWTNEKEIVSRILQEYVALRKQQDGVLRGEVPCEAIKRIKKNGQLLKIKQTEEEELWDSEWLNLTEEEMQLFTPSKEGELSLSMGPITPGLKNLDGSSALGQNKEDIPQTE